MFMQLLNKNMHWQEEKTNETTKIVRDVTWYNFQSQQEGHMLESSLFMHRSHAHICWVNSKLLWLLKYFFPQIIAKKKKNLLEKLSPGSKLSQVIGIGTFRHSHAFRRTISKSSYIFEELLLICVRSSLCIKVNPQNQS